MTTTENRVLVLGEDEKSASIMLYTDQYLLWGDVIVKKIIRLSTWLRSNAAPEVIHLYNARSIIITYPAVPHPAFSSEVLIFSSHVDAYHLVPPDKDSFDYDISEPNRTMFPVTARVSTFSFEGKMRLSVLSNPAKYLEINREEFTGLYDVRINNTIIHELGYMHVPFVLLRQSKVVYSLS